MVRSGRDWLRWCLDVQVHYCLLMSNKAILFVYRYQRTPSCDDRKSAFPVVPTVLGTEKTQRFHRGAESPAVSHNPLRYPRIFCGIPESPASPSCCGVCHVTETGCSLRVRCHDIDLFLLMSFGHNQFSNAST